MRERKNKTLNKTADRNTEKKKIQTQTSGKM